MLELSPEVPALSGSLGAPAAAAETSTKKKRFGIVFWICAGWIGLVILAAIFASLLPLKNPDSLVAIPRMGPSMHYPLGTDDLGRDVLSRVVYGARVSMIVGFSSIAFGLLVGGTLGLIAGYYKGRIGRIIMGCMDVLLAFPALVFALALISFLGQNLRNVVIAIGVLSVAPIARLIRASTLTFSEREFVVAARALGAKDFRIITREILPNVAVPTLSYSLVAVAVAIVAEGGLAFLGLSVRPPTPSWGGMINEGRTYLAHAAYMSLIPAGVLFVTVLAFNFVGDSLRSRFDPRRGALS